MWAVLSAIAVVDGVQHGLPWRPARPRRLAKLGLLTIPGLGFGATAFAPSGAIGLCGRHRRAGGRRRGRPGAGTAGAS
jgi:hypothetical protein